MIATLLQQVVHTLRMRLAPKRTDALGREQGQAMLRVTISVIVFLYLNISHWPLDDDFSSGIPGWFGFLAVFITWSALIAVHARRDNDSRLWRRTATNAGDIIAISYLMINTHEAGIPLFVLYLWVTLGNGFRFGVRSLAVSTALSLAGFSAVYALSPVWRDLTMVSVAVLLALVIVPLYASHLIRQLSAALKYAEEANAAKSAFVARMSHEMRTPLNGILGTAGLLLESKRLTPEERSLLGVIEDSVNVSLRQINNILDFSKLEAGKLVLEHTPFDLHELLTSTARMLRAGANEKGLRLMVRVAPATPYALIGDPHHLREILLNLLSNAIKFTERGYVALEAVALREDQHSATVRFEVRDTGIGIAPQAIGRIFDSFVQEDASTTRRYGGTGLGTTIAKQLVELMRGRIGVDSVKGQGSTFWAEIAFARQAVAPALPAGLVGVRALLISEDSDMRAHWRKALVALGGSLTAVASPAEAIDALAKSIRFGNPYHTVFAERGAVIGPSGVHRGSDLLDRAYMTNINVVLISQPALDAAQLREWGYSGQLAPNASLELIHNVLRQSEGYRDDRPQGVIRVEPWAWQGPKARGIRVLAADDNRTNLMILTKILNGAHYEVETAADGEVALEKLLTGFYRVAILDMHMPGLDGPDVVRQYRHMRPRSRLPIVMLTANATSEAQLECADAGADAYLTKPATPDEVLDTLARVLAESTVTRLEEPERVAVAAPILERHIITALSVAMGGEAQALHEIANTFYAEGRELLAAIEAAVASRNHPTFIDRTRALQAHAAYVGARRLAEACERATASTFAAFQAARRELQQQIASEFDEAISALREFTGADDAAHQHGR